MRRLARPPALLLICLATWLVLGPAALRTLDLNLTHLALRAWNPLAGRLPAGAPSAPPGCVDSPDASVPGPCDRAAALAWLAGDAADGPARAVRLLDRPATQDPLDLYFLGLAEERAGNLPAAWWAWARIGAEDRI